MKAWKQFLSLVLVTCLLTSLFGVVSAAGPDGAQDTGVQDTGPKYVGVFDSSETNTNLTLENRETTIKFYLKNVETGEKLDVDSYESQFTSYPFDTFMKVTKTEILPQEDCVLVTVDALYNTDSTQVRGGASFKEGVEGILIDDLTGEAFQEGDYFGYYYGSCNFTISDFPVYQIGLAEENGVKLISNSGPRREPPAQFIDYNLTIREGESVQLKPFITKDGELVSNPPIIWDMFYYPSNLDAPFSVDENGVVTALHKNENYASSQVYGTYEAPESSQLNVKVTVRLTILEGDPDDGSGDSGDSGSGGSSSGSSGGGSSTGGNSGTAMPNTGSGTITTPGTGTTTPGGGSTAGGASAPNSQPQGCVSDTVGNFNIFGAYQYKFTPTNGQAPVVTVSNSNFRVVQVAQEDGSYYYKVYSVGAPGTTCDVYVNGTKVSTVTASEPYGGVSCDTTAPFTVKKGGSYQFMFTAASRPTVSAGSSSFHVEFAGNDGDKWYFKAVATGNAGDGCGFYVNGAPFTVAVAHIGE